MILLMQKQKIQPKYQTSEKTPLAPALVALSHFPLQDPSNNMPLLEWREDLNAVYYELELFDTIPDDLSDEELSSEHFILYSLCLYKR